MLVSAFHVFCLLQLPVDRECSCATPFDTTSKGIGISAKTLNQGMPQNSIDLINQKSSSMMN